MVWATRRNRSRQQEGERSIQPTFSIIIADDEMASNRRKTFKGAFRMASRSVSPITEARIKGTFSKLANGAASAVGTHWAFLAAISSILIWAAFGPRFHYSDTWQ